MATMIVRHQVADFGIWKKEFDAMHDIRMSHGWIGHEVLRDTADPNKVTIINKVRSVKDAKAYGASAELKEAMQIAGVVSTPDITILQDEEILSY
jgi:heme-degrading monooxygenase HmoA